MADHTDARGDCLAAARAGATRALDGFRAGIAAEQKGGDDIDSVTAADRAAQRVVRERLGAAYPDEPVVGEEGDAPDHLPATGAAWVVDPIDGTVNFVGGRRVWATSVARAVDREPVAAATVAPVLGDAYVADRTDAWREPADESAADPDRESLGVADETAPERFLVNPLFGPSPAARERLAAVAPTLVTGFGDLRRIGCAQLALAGVASGALHATVSTVELNDWDTVAGVHLIRCAGGRVTDIDGDRWEPGATGLVASNDTAHDRVVTTVREAADGA
ncbi:MAG: archaeal fructose-1,6-bisphosphatase related enzymes of inositol monophosphatase family [halophilic archaeon J07HB67]|jgi:Archaeal fructose-1,6-bisphosphatase and related enzymes of inositol monophosphatase family|nr:MAG: archaeal fructose-1,6-bisphosphatase related enzymes of inositol monophosphatase family [halophilic archaeon J07HB67]